MEILIKACAGSLEPAADSETLQRWNSVLASLVLWLIVNDKAE